MKQSYIHTQIRVQSRLNANVKLPALLVLPVQLPSILKCWLLKYLSATQIQGNEEKRLREQLRTAYHNLLDVIHEVS